MVSFKKTKPEFDPITHEDVLLETVDHFKLLGIWVSNNMTWKHHVDHISAVAPPRLYYLKQQRRCGVATEGQLMFYKSVITPITEYLSSQHCLFVEIYYVRHFLCNYLSGD